MIGGNVPKHLVTGARTGFLTALRRREYPWAKVAELFNMTAKSQDLVDLGASPMPKKSDEAGGLTVQEMIEKSVTVKPVSWDLTVSLSQNAIDDDQTGSLKRKVSSAGDNFQKHLNQLVFTVLNGGDGTTYGKCYDTQDFFDSDHTDPGASYQTAQDNEFTLNLSSDNFETVWVAAQATRDDQGEFTEYIYDLLVCHPTNKRVASNITQNVEEYDTANREKNPFAGEITYITTPEIDSAAWFVIASGESVKPLVVAMRKQPHLQASWFDPTLPDGGHYFFKYYARYDVKYLDWRLAFQGQT